MSGAGTGSTLRRRMVVAAISATLLVVVGVALVFAANYRMRRQLTAATRAFVEEQKIADRIGQALVRQLLAASSGALRSEAAWHDFDEAGAEVYTQIQRFLFRPLSTPERLQLEQMKRQHQRLEVAAVAAARSLDASADAVEGREEMFVHASALLEVMEAFLELREAELDRLRAGQGTAFGYLFLTTGLVAAALLAGSLLVGRYLHHHVGRPLTELAGAAARIGGGDLATRVTVHRDDELGAVAESFNRMAESLAASQHRLEARNEELARALDTVRETQAELVQAEKLSALGRMTAGLAHELNNPLASVHGYVELLAEEVREADGPAAAVCRGEYLEPLLLETTRARELVHNLLRFARKSDSSLGPVPLHEALEVVVGLRSYAFERDGIRLTLGDVPDVWVRAERQRLQDAFLNIVNNALEAVTEVDDRGTELRIHGVLEAGAVSLFFDDDGPGVEWPERVFEPFFTTKPVGRGTGLGLALVHRFVAECGGSVSADRSPAGGARFVMRLETCEPPERAPEEDPARRPELKGGRRGLEGEPRVLVVEDEPHLRALQSRLLRKLGAQPIVAASVAEAREVLTRERVDLVVSDVRMPEESGIGLYRWLQEHRPELTSSFVFVTGDVHGEETGGFATARPELFIHKPFEIDEYLARISSMLEGRGAAVV